MRRVVVLFVTLVAIFSACHIAGQEPDNTYPPQTRIVRIDMTPDTVVMRDTMFIHCVIEDSLDNRFKYSWLLGDAKILPVDGSTRGAYIQFIAPSFNSYPRDTTIIYSGSVIADNGSSDSIAVSGDVNIPLLIK